jgi:hypothetical protein
MALRAHSPADELARLAHVKATPSAMGSALGPELISFFKTSVQKRQTKLQKIAEAWSQLVPELLNEHCALEGFSRGTLIVLVDTASHLYELKQLLLAGLEKQLLVACKSSGLTRITLKRGRWYDGGDSSDRRLRFA